MCMNLKQVRSNRVNSVNSVKAAPNHDEVNHDFIRPHEHLLT
jgi:hypothetical protein